jgi:hypothetical protein
MPNQLTRRAKRLLMATLLLCVIVLIITPLLNSQTQIVNYCQ